MDSNIVDRWIAAEETIAMETSVVHSDRFVTVQRMITIGDGAPEMAVIPLARGDELDRLIAALQRARGGPAVAEPAVVGQPAIPTRIPLSLSNIVEGARRMLHVEGRTLLIGIIALVLFVLFVGGR